MLIFWTWHHSDHVLMDLANQIEFEAERVINVNRTDREYTVLPNNLVVFQVNVANVYEGECIRGV